MQKREPKAAQHVFTACVAMALRCGTTLEMAGRWQTKHRRDMHVVHVHVQQGWSTWFTVNHTLFKKEKGEGYDVNL